MAKSAGHGDVLARGSDVWLTWTERHSGRSQLWWQVSRDSGRTWQAAEMTADIPGPADYPFVHLIHGRPTISWASPAGHRIIEVEKELPTKRLNERIH